LRNLSVKSSDKKTAGRIVMAVTGSVLIIATVLKIHHLLTEPIISETFWESWYFFLIQIPLELGLGIWLVCGLFRKAAHLVAVICFALFTVVTMQKAITGAESCGCFGRVHVNPWITLSAIDIPILAALLIFQIKNEKLLPPPWPSFKRLLATAVPTFLLMAVIMPVLIFNRPPEKSDNYEVVRPEEWITKPHSDNGQTGGQWPMLKYIDIADLLQNNIAVVVLYSSECDTCHDAIPLYEQMSRDMTDNADTIRFAFIEIPPYGSQQDRLVSPDTPCLTGRVDASKDWYIKTPLVVVLQDGLLVKFWSGQTPGIDQIIEAVSSEAQLF
jgi:hypothetical protein